MQFSTTKDLLGNGFWSVKMQTALLLEESQKQTTCCTSFHIVPLKKGQTRPGLLYVSLFLREL